MDSHGLRAALPKHTSRYCVGGRRSRTALTPPGSARFSSDASLPSPPAAPRRSKGPPRATIRNHQIRNRRIRNLDSFAGGERARALERLRPGGVGTDFARGVFTRGASRRSF